MEEGAEGGIIGDLLFTTRTTPSFARTTDMEI
jgi:hypothetical protein